MNKVVLSGRLTRDPQISYTSGQDSFAVARYTLAVDRRGRQDEEQSADFVSCVAFRKSAEFVEKYLHKGTKILVYGHIQTGSYQNKDGHTVYTTDVIADEHEFCESRSAAAQEKPEEQKQTASEEWMTIPDDVSDEGLPFN